MDCGNRVNVTAHGIPAAKPSHSKPSIKPCMGCGEIGIGDANMNIARPIGTAEIEKSLEVEIGGNIQELARGSSAVFRQGEGSDAETSTDNLAALLRRVAEASTREVDSLIGDLQTLRRKLSADGNRIQREIAEYAELSQQVTQLTNIISESVKKLPTVSGINR